MNGENGLLTVATTLVGAFAVWAVSKTEFRHQIPGFCSDQPSSEKGGNPEMLGA